MHDEPLVPDDRPLRSKGDGLQPTRAEAKVGLAIASLLLVLYAMWAWAPWQDGDPSCVEVEGLNGATTIQCSAP